MIIDIHNHPDWLGHNFESFVKNLDEYQIDKSCVLSWEVPEDEYDHSHGTQFIPNGPRGPIPFERCVAYVERAPERFILGYCPDPRRPEAIDQLQCAVDIYHARICGELKVRMMYDNPDALRMFRFCGEKGIPVLVHIDYEFDTGVKYPRPNWWYGGGIEALERAVKACPETDFIGHAPGFWSHISGDDLHDREPYPEGKVLQGGKITCMLRKYQNLYCDISAESGWTALKRDPEFTKEFLTEFQDRVLYGRDQFDNIHQELLNGIGLQDNVLQKIYSGNALKLLKI